MARRNYNTKRSFLFKMIQHIGLISSSNVLGLPARTYHITSNQLLPVCLRHHCKLLLHHSTEYMNLLLLNWTSTASQPQRKALGTHGCIIFGAIVSFDNVLLILSSLFAGPAGRRHCQCQQWMALSHGLYFIWSWTKKFSSRGPHKLMLMCKNYTGEELGSVHNQTTW